jgi:hypothetical protein
MAVAGIAKREKEEEGKLDIAAQGEQQDISGIEERTAQGESRLADEAGKLTPPKFQAVPPPTVQPTDPKQIWGSAAMFIAAFGGLMTRQPMTSALNAAAGVINAYKKGDQEAANQAFQTWKISNDNAIKAAEFEQKAYDEALASIDRRTNALDRQGAAQVREAVAKFTSVAAAFHNDLALQVAQTNDVAHLFNFTEDYGLKIDQAQVAGGKAAEEHAVIADQAEWDKKHPHATADERLDHFAETRAKLSPSHEWSPSEIASTADREIAALQRPNTVGAAYNTVAQKLFTIHEYATSPPGVVSQASLADAFTQIINGGRAIRGFQMQMLTEHAGAVDKAMAAANQILAHGGQLSPQMTSDMIQIAGSVAKEIDSAYKNQIDALQARGEKLGIPDTSVLTPPEYDPDLVPSLTANYSPPPPEAIGYLKAHPDMRDQYDQKYGPGAAAKVLGQ